MIQNDSIEIDKRADHSVSPFSIFLKNFWLMTIMSTTMISAYMSIAVVMIVVVAFYVRVISKRTIKQCFNRLVRITADTSKKLDTCIG